MPTTKQPPRPIVPRVFTTLLAALVAVAFALSATTSQAEPEGKPLRVGGDYTVTAIDRLNDHEFHVEFKAVAPTGKFDVLTLQSDHVHVSVRVGQKLRLAAQILSTKGNTAEVSEMVIFIPNAQGPVPVWLLSNKAQGLDLRATDYLKMHSPLTDYMVM